MNKYFFSPVFGDVRPPTEEEQTQVAIMLIHCPQYLFGQLNLRLNERNFCLSLGRLPEPPGKQ